MESPVINIGTDFAVYELGAENAPAAFCESGEVVRFETMDCFADQIHSDSPPFDYVDWSKSNPATGPLFVRGALPGDILKVDILSIELAEQALVMEFPGDGISGKKAEKETARVLPVSNGQAQFSTGLSLPLRPMIGVIGTAAAQEAVPTSTPGSHGGNMDCTRICAGSSLYLPVYVEGALLSMGDLHALMGDGEVCVCGGEIAGAVTVKLTVIKGEELPLPLLVTEEHCITIASAATLDEAAEEATFAMRRLLMEKAGMEAPEAGMLMSLVGDLRICQAVNPLKTCRMEMPISVLTKL